MAGPHADSEAEVVGRHDHADPLAGKKLHVTLVTPQGSVLSAVADEVQAPGVQGEFGVLPGHIAFLTALRPGVLTVKMGGTREIYAIGGGHAQVGAGDEIRLLVSRAEKGASVDVDAARADLERLTEELKAATGATAEETAETRARLDWARARVDAHDRAGGGGAKEH
jgi:F-type H+-transporting ATPase subunit epsilon